MVTGHGRRKRERGQRVGELFKELRELELLHKQSLAVLTYRRLIRVREELNDLLFAKTKQRLLRGKRTLYEYSNKPGRLLVRALRGLQTKTFIPRIQSSTVWLQVMVGDFGDLDFKLYDEQQGPDCGRSPRSDKRQRLLSRPHTERVRLHRIQELEDIGYPTVSAGKQSACKCITIENHTAIDNKIEKASEIQKQINKIFSHIDAMMPKVTFVHIDNTTSAIKSKMFIKSPQKNYCVGDKLIVQVNAYDHLGKKKTYGGDYLRAIISNPDLQAGASGRIEDFKNGTYHVYFTLFWEGEVVVRVFLMHPSEAVSSLWKSRNSWYGNVGYLCKFTSPGKQVETNCGFNLSKEEKLCTYIDERDEEYFYSVRPQNFSCDSLTEFKNWKTLATQLSPLENSLLVSSRVRVEIPQQISEFNVSRCGSNLETKEKCKTGGKLEYPSGYFMKDIWYPKTCSMQTYHQAEELNACMTGKFFYMFGDSTTHQWIFQFETKLKNIKFLNVYENGWSQKHLAVDTERNIHVLWKHHARPFIYLGFTTLREERTIPHEIDLIGGNQYTIIAFNIGVHFRLFPVHHYIKRLYNIRRAIERLFLRSPETKVIIKTENTSEMQVEYEGMSDFHAYVHYLIMEIIFKDINVGFINGWDMTTAFHSNQIHPPPTYVRNEINMMMTYSCS
ncbi:PREDICTED: NXPE family member 1-like [Nanorana parkeri]|uniref:NXPE family member 1-like n=1 Tax=Nanorana parkeri TaxID=125878 RepID=UPI000854A5FE|nr:PREDICTED: NXPE family member 1-like [Nanorana parkeri]